MLEDHDRLRRSAGHAVKRGDSRLARSRPSSHGRGYQHQPSALRNQLDLSYEEINDELFDLLKRFSVLFDRKDQKPDGDELSRFLDDSMLLIDLSTRGAEATGGIAGFGKFSSTRESKRKCCSSRIDRYMNMHKRNVLTSAVC